ncbi:hypothetical protein NL676_020729 [Syzygium grande]|nr:hypothetical protein NL676_020729 [Syzygium grande]
MAPGAAAEPEKVKTGRDLRTAGSRPREAAPGGVAGEVGVEDDVGAAVEAVAAEEEAALAAAEEEPAGVEVEGDHDDDDEEEDDDGGEHDPAAEGVGPLRRVGAGVVVAGSVAVSAVVAAVDHGVAVTDQSDQIVQADSLAEPAGLRTPAYDYMILVNSAGDQQKVSASSRSCKSPSYDKFRKGKGN